MWIYGAYLLPYVLISYYDRYAAPLLGIKMVLVAYGVDTVIDRLKNQRRRKYYAKDAAVFLRPALHVAYYNGHRTANPN